MVTGVAGRGLERLQSRHLPLRRLQPLVPASRVLALRRVRRRSHPCAIPGFRFGAWFASPGWRPGRTAAPAPPIEVKTPLGWLRNGEFAPIIVAEAKGFFAEEGIRHRILDGGLGTAFYQEYEGRRVASGQTS